MKKYSGTKTLEILEGADNYNLWISSQILKHANPPILEFGSGTGNITQHVIHLTPFTISEIDPDLIKRLNKSFKKKNIEITEFDITLSTPKKFVNKFNTVFSTNVLEHVEDDLNALKNIKNTLKSGGNLILLVPAKKFAYTKVDENLGHHRRYEKNELRNLLKKAGFEVETIYFFNILGLLAWKIRDQVTRNNELKSSQVKVFDSIVPFLRILESIIRPPVGISLIVVAKKIK